MNLVCIIINIFMKSRSDWLKYTKHYQKIERTGRKRFDIHKNDHKIVFFPESPDKIKKDNSLVNYSNISPEPRVNYKGLKINANIDKSFNGLAPLKSSRTPEPKKNTNSSVIIPLEPSYFYKQLKDKDRELQMLKSLYNDTSRKLQ